MAVLIAHTVLGSTLASPFSRVFVRNGVVFHCTRRPVRDPSQAQRCGLCRTEPAPPAAADRPLLCVLQALGGDKETPPI